MEEDQIEHLLSPKQLVLWEWVNTQSEAEFSRKDIIDVLGFQARTAESAIKKLLDLKKLERVGEGRATRYRKV